MTHRARPSESKYGNRQTPFSDTPTGTHGTAHIPARRESDGALIARPVSAPTPPPREGAAPCGGPSTPSPHWSLPNSSADALRAQAIERARQDNSERLERILATIAVVVILVALVALMTATLVASVRP